MNTHLEYTTGIKTETRLIAFLRSNGYTITPSSKRENCELDIDCYCGAVPISIKTQHTCLKTGNVAFELEVTTREGNKELGWFRLGEAVIYWILIGRQLYTGRKHDITEYVLQYGWRRQARLSERVAASQKKIGHKHVDALMGLLSLTELLDAGVLKWLCTVPTDVAYPNRRP